MNAARLGAKAEEIRKEYFSVFKASSIQWNNHMTVTHPKPVDLT